MRLPIVLAVDDEPDVLAAVARDLRRRYARDCRVLTAPSGDDALQLLERLRSAGDPVALVLADQRMPGTEGVALLERAAVLAPEAKRVLLTAYADTQAAIDAINRAGVDHYLVKPWDPPEERLYPVLDDLLRDWRRSTFLPWDGIRVWGAAWSARAHEIRSFLARHRIPFRYVDVDAGPAAIDAAPPGLRIPTVILPSGEHLVEPELATLAASVGLHTEAAHAHYDLVVVGAGPAGLAASVYAAAEGLQCLVIERDQIGGLASSSPRIENYLGFPSGIAGADLTRRFHDQAVRLGAEILTMREVRRVRVEEACKVLELADGEEITASAVLIATGASFRTLPAVGADRLHGTGVYYSCSNADLQHVADQDVLVIGGGNAAAQAALMLSRTARHVTMLVRGSVAVASQYLLDAIAATPGVTIRLNTEVIEARGSDRLEEVLMNDGEVVAASSLFVFVGVRPSSDFVKDLCVCNDRGFLLTGPQLGRPPGWPLARDPMLLETSVPGIFAAGDVRAGTIGRVAWSAGEGGASVGMVLEHLRGWKTGSRTAAES